MDEILLSRIRKEAYEQGYQDGKVDAYDLIATKQIKQKHGKWIFIGGYKYQYRCSVCNSCEEYRTKFCPHCGAEMAREA